MPPENTIRIAIELSVSSWLVAARLPGAEKSRLYRIEGGDTAALLARIDELRARAAPKSGPALEVACCFEAGRDGFWLHRWLTAHGVIAYVLEPTSILVNRRARRAKTDRLDAEGMLRVLAAWQAGDRQVCSMVHVPTPEEEDAKRPHREREHLVRERQRIENRMEALLFTQGIRGRPSLRSWERDMAALRTGDGRAVPPLMQAELNRLRRHLVQILEQIREVEAERAEAQAAAVDDATTRKILALQRIRGIGTNFAAVLVHEVFTVPLPTAANSAAMSALRRCPIKVAAWTVIAASVGLATHAHARHSFNLPGCGCAISRTANWPNGSASVSVCCRAVRAGSPSSPWRESF